MPCPYNAPMDAEVAMTDKELILRYVKDDQNLHDEAEVRLADSLIHVWAIVAQLKVNDWNVKQTARDYGVPEIEVEAALAHYRWRREVIDARTADHVIVRASDHRIGD